MPSTPSTLGQAVRLRTVGRYSGQLLLVLAVLAVPPLVVALVAGEPDFLVHIAAGGAVTGGLGWALSRLRASRRLQTNEAIVVVALLFLLAPLMLATAMTAAGLTFVDALFESVSGVTTTGLSVITPGPDTPATLLFLRAWLQWFGGLGFVVLSLGFVVQPGIVARRLAVSEQAPDDLVGGMRAHARWVLRIYASLTGLAWLVLVALGTGPFDALLYAMAAVSTGGFAPQSGSLGALAGWGPRFGVMAFCLAGALPFVAYRHLIHRRWRTLLQDLQIRWLILGAIATSVALLLWLTLVESRSLPVALPHALLVGLSAQTTAGFTTLDPATLAPAGKLLLIPAMVVGGCAGSTAGGIKIVRLLVLLEVGRTLIQRTALPRHAVLEPRLQGGVLTRAEIRPMLVVVAAFAVLALLSWWPFVWQGHDPIGALFEVSSAMGTVGLTAGITGPDLAPGLKLVLCVDMLLGRLEVLPLLVLLYPRTWLGRRRWTE